MSDEPVVDVGEQTGGPFSPLAGRRMSDPYIIAVWEDVRDIKKDLRDLRPLPARLSALEESLKNTREANDKLITRLDTTNDRVAVLEKKEPLSAYWNRIVEKIMWLLIAGALVYIAEHAVR